MNMKRRPTSPWIAAAFCVATIAALSAIVAASGAPSGAKPAVILVHGAFADATGWQHVIPILERDGYAVTAVQNPLTSFDADVATTRRAIEAEAKKGPVVVVGHSYGGAVITLAAVGLPQVKALAYVAAFAPDDGESLGGLLERGPQSDIGPALVPDAAGFLSIDRAKFQDVFAHDVQGVEARVMAATQKPIAGEIFQAKCTKPAWKSIPSYYLVARQDHAIHPDLQRFMAERMKAHTIEVDSSHVPFVSKPADVARFIEDAATGVER